MTQVLDMAVVAELLSLSDDGDPELLLDLITLFLDDGPAKIQAMQEGVAERDFEKMERAAHSLKGSSGNLGARQLQDTCERIQLATRKRDFKTSQLLAPQMQTQFAEVCGALQTLRSRYS